VKYRRCRRAEVFEGLRRSFELRTARASSYVNGFRTQHLALA
jgi:hypothetical protein